MFRGSMVALVTPMQENGEIDIEVLRNLVEWHIESGTSAIVAVGTTGECGTLTDAEKLTVIGHVVEQAKERIAVIAGTGAIATQHTIDLTRGAMEKGVDGCLLMTPAYVKPTQEGLYCHYESIAKAVAVPQILYNVPSRTACDLLPETVGRLSKLSNIIGIKEATGKVDRVKQILEYSNDGIDVFSGEDLSAKDLMLAGSKGVISVTANVVPKLMRKMTEAALSGHRVEADAMHDKLLPLHQALFIESNPIPCKFALCELQKIKSGIRLPLTPLSVKYQQIVRDALRTVSCYSH